MISLTLASFARMIAVLSSIRISDSAYVELPQRQYDDLRRDHRHQRGPVEHIHTEPPLSKRARRRQKGKGAKRK